jgi:DNA-binding CsgD family transcriptional regulator
METLAYTPVGSPAGGDAARRHPGRPGSRIGLLDLQCRLLDATPEFGRQFGSELVSGLRFLDLLHPSVRERAHMDFARIRSVGPDRFSRDIIGLGPMNRAFSSRLTGIALHGARGQVTELLVILGPNDRASSDSLTPISKKMLSRLDAQILEGVAAGESNAQIARRLHRSRQGIEYRVTALFRKLGARSRASLIARACSVGLIHAGAWPPRVLVEFIE